MTGHHPPHQRRGPTPNPAAVANPGDTDLDLDLRDTRICSVVRMDHDLLVTVAAGCGYFLIDGTRTRMIGINADLTVCYDPRTFPERAVEAVHRTLLRWQRTGVRLQVVAAPGRLTRMITPELVSLIVPLA